MIILLNIFSNNYSLDQKKVIYLFAVLPNEILQYLNHHYLF